MEYRYLDDIVGVVNMRRIGLFIVCVLLALMITLPAYESSAEAAGCAPHVEILTKREDLAKGAPLVLKIELVLSGYTYLGSDVYIGDHLVYSFTSLEENNTEKSIPYSIWSKDVKYDREKKRCDLDVWYVVRIYDPVFGIEICDSEQETAWESKEWPLVEKESVGFQSITVEAKIGVSDYTKIMWNKEAEQEQADEYYRALIPLIKKGKDPMKDNVFVELLKQRLEEKGYGDQASSIIDTLKRADKIYKELYLLSFYNYGLYTSMDDTAIYDYPPNGLVMSQEYISGNKSSQFSDVFFHESGHAVQLNRYDWSTVSTINLLENGDWRIPAAAAGNVEQEEEIMRLLNEDVSDRLSKVIKKKAGKLSKEDQGVLKDAFMDVNDRLTFEYETTSGFWFWKEKTVSNYPESLRSHPELVSYYDEVREEMIKQIGDAGACKLNNGLMGSDIYGGMTDNKINAGYGHTYYKNLDYWTRQNEDGDQVQNGQQYMEAWAEFFSAKIRKDTDAIKSNKTLFPKATAEMEKYAKNLRDQYYDHYLALYGQ